LTVAFDSQFCVWAEVRLRDPPVNVPFLPLLTGLRELIRSFQVVQKDFPYGLAAICSRS